MTEIIPPIRSDLEFIPVQHDSRHFVLVRDHLGLVREGMGVPLSLYHIMLLFNGKSTIRDIQMALMRQQGGVLVGTDEVAALVDQLDTCFLLDTIRFRQARERMVEEFSSLSVRPCSHRGSAYPEGAPELRQRLEEILTSQPPLPPSKGKRLALIAPHIDLSVGQRGYSMAYQNLRQASFSRVVVLGVGHRMGKEMFSLTEKDFETPIGRVETDTSLVRELSRAGGGLIAENDIAHLSEHSIEFQILFLRYLLSDIPMKIVPILCGSLQTALPQYSREAYLHRASAFLNVLSRILSDPDGETLLVAGIDLTHVGPKFGHEVPARLLAGQAEDHDKKLLTSMCERNAERLWEESARVQDTFNVCGFSALACLCEVLPDCRGRILHYETWHEEPTQSAVSFGAAVFEA